jgi:hypothetical protein
MTALDERQAGLWPAAATIADELTALADQLSADVMPATARRAARALYDEVTVAYRLILAGAPGVTAGQRAQVRAAARAFALAGGCADEAADHIGRIAGRAVDGAVALRRQHTLPILVTAGSPVVRELLAGTGEADARQAERPNRELVRRLVLGADVPAGSEHGLAAAYDIVVLRPVHDVSEHRLTALLAEFEGLGMLAGWMEAGVVLLVPASASCPAERAAQRCAAGLGDAVFCATARRPRQRIASGYEEAMDVLTLAFAAGRRPGVFRLDDFLIEYAVLRQATVAESLLAIIRPLLANAMLGKTLAALIEADFNRTLAARALFVHRSTLDYRIRRIEEITGHNPMSGRGAQVLCAAMTANAVADTMHLRGNGNLMRTAANGASGQL